MIITSLDYQCHASKSEQEKKNGSHPKIDKKKSNYIERERITSDSRVDNSNWIFNQSPTENKAEGGYQPAIRRAIAEGEEVADAGRDFETIKPYL